MTINSAKPRALVVYESEFGNTERIAHALAEGLSTWMMVDVLPVDRAPHAVGPPYQLLAVGGPTHALSMSTRASREEALRRGGHHGVVGTGLREWINVLKLDPAVRTLAAFDTRIYRGRRLPGSAARAAARALHRRNRTTVAATTRSFYVLGESGSLLEDQESLAREWGRSLALRRAEPAADRSRGHR